MKPNFQLYELVMTFHKEFFRQCLMLLVACSFALSLFWDFLAHRFQLFVLYLHDHTLFGCCSFEFGTDKLMDFSAFLTCRPLRSLFRCCDNKTDYTRINCYLNYM